MSALVRHAARSRADPAPARPASGCRGPRRQRDRCHRAGRRWHHSDDQGHRQRRPAHAASEIPGRRRWRAQQGARIARHPVRRAWRLLQQHHDLFHRGSGAADARQAAERDLHQQSAVRRLFPFGEGLPVRISGGEHGRRSQDQSGCCQRREGRQRAATCRARACRCRRTRPAGERSPGSRVGARRPTWRAAFRMVAFSSPAMPLI